MLSVNGAALVARRRGIAGSVSVMTGAGELGFAMLN
jgi:hypothetical protein